MSMRQLVEGDCGGVNPLIQLGAQLVQDAAHKDEGIAQAQFERSMHQDEHMVNEFLGQVAGPPQSFQMETLMEEMREIEQNQMNPAHLPHAPRVIDEVASGWSKEFRSALHLQPSKTHDIKLKDPTRQFKHGPKTYRNLGSPRTGFNGPKHRFVMYPNHPNEIVDTQEGTDLTNQFFEEVSAVEKSFDSMQVTDEEDWVNDYETSNESNEQITVKYNEAFWKRLQEDWVKLSEESEQQWLSDYDRDYDPYEVYTFSETSTLHTSFDVLKKGKEYLDKYEIPNAVLCFEATVQETPHHAEAWELLGLSQSLNEMDPLAIAAFKKSLELNPNNPKVLIDLAVCYTNENLPSLALNMLTRWLQIHPKYKHLAPSEEENSFDASGLMRSSLIRGNKLKEVQKMFLQAACMSPQAIDPQVQDALGILYNLSSEYGKAVDCFQAALQADPKNARIWNRLGASLANGSRSIEAVRAYQQALDLRPGYIRVRYNVGVCCLNLKAYRQAADHFLLALNMQTYYTNDNEIPNPVLTPAQARMSESIWNSLKMVISLMGRNDLQGYVNERNLSALNEAL